MATLEQKPDVERNEITEEKPTDINHERAQLLANLPDPDAGKSEEERAEIVSAKGIHSSTSGN